MRYTHLSPRAFFTPRSVRFRCLQKRNVSITECPHQGARIYRNLGLQDSAG
jgi:hypothetical protein